MVLAPGTYGSPATPLTGSMISVKVARIAPQISVPKPHLYIGGTGFLSIYNGGTLSDVDIDSTSTSSTGTVFAFGSTIERVVVRSTGGKACRTYHQATILNSVCATNAPAAPAIEMLSPTGSPMNAVLRNVTAWSGGAGGVGMTASASDAGGPTPLTVHVSNSIIRGTSIDFQAITDSTAGTSVTATFDHSNFQQVVNTGTGTSVTPAGTATNQTAPPILANPAGFDFAERIGSPTIDAGVTDFAFGTLDALHNTRAQGASTDIGGLEFAPEASAITAMSMKPTKFRSARNGATISASKAKKTPVGAKLTLTLNMTSRVAFTVERQSAGRKDSKGKCVKPARSNRRGKPCARFVTIGKKIFFDLPTGDSVRTFSGRVSKKKLKPGKYRIKAIPTAFGAAAGAPAYAKFTIVR